MTRRSARRVGVINLMTLVLGVVVLVILGVRFGWRIPVAVTVFYALWGLRLVTEPREPGRLRTTVEFIVFALIGMMLGAFAFGALGGIFGFTVGFVARLAEVPTTGVFRSRKPRDTDAPHSG
jgi:hypothetical protein